MCIHWRDPRRICGGTSYLGGRDYPKNSRKSSVSGEQIQETMPESHCWAAWNGDGHASPRLPEWCPQWKTGWSTHPTMWYIDRHIRYTYTGNFQRVAPRFWNDRFLRGAAEPPLIMTRKWHPQWYHLCMVEWERAQLSVGNINPHSFLNDMPWHKMTCVDTRWHVLARLDTFLTQFDTFWHVPKTTRHALRGAVVAPLRAKVCYYHTGAECHLTGNVTKWHEVTHSDTKWHKMTRSHTKSHDI